MKYGPGSPVWEIVTIILSFDDLVVNSRNTLFIAQSNLPGRRACMYLIGQRSAVKMLIPDKVLTDECTVFLSCWPYDAVSYQLRCVRRRSCWVSATSWRFVCLSCGRTSPSSLSKCVGKCRGPSLQSVPASTSHPTHHRLLLSRVHPSPSHLCRNKSMLHVCLMCVPVRGGWRIVSLGWRCQVWGRITQSVHWCWDPLRKYVAPL